MLAWCTGKIFITRVVHHLDFHVGFKKNLVSFKVTFSFFQKSQASRYGVKLRSRVPYRATNQLKHLHPKYMERRRVPSPSGTRLQSLALFAR